MEHILRLLARHGFDDVIANLHYFPDMIREPLRRRLRATASQLSYRYEEELLGTAGGVRNVRDHFGDETFLIISGDALTDIDLDRAARSATRRTAASRTLALKRVDDTSEFGVVIVDADGRIQGFQEKPDPAEALSDLGNCGIYVFEPEIFDYFPEPAVRRLGAGRLPGAAGAGRAVLRPRDRRRTGTTSAPWTSTGRATSTRWRRGRERGGRGDAPRAGRRRERRGGRRARRLGPVLVGEGCGLDSGARLDGPLVICDGASVGAGAFVKHSVLLPGAQVPAGAIVAGAIYGRAGALA